MNIFYERYAELIVKQALKLKAGDVLSINTEEENSSFAHIISDAARRITGNGSYIQLIENGKVTHVEEASTDFPINKKPTALLYIPVYREYDQAEENKLYSAPELQSFKMLSDPINTQTPVLPYCTVPSPSDAWGAMLDQEDGYSLLSEEMISDLLSLGEDDYIESAADRERILLYEAEKFNSLNLSKARIYSEEGTDLTLEFLPGSSFAASIEKTSDGKCFIPSLFASDILRALDRTKTNGYLNITHPIMVFGRRIANLSISFEDGRITSFTGDNNAIKLMNLYLAQDNNAGYASMLSISEDNNPAAFIDYIALPEWDRMRGTSLIIGGCRSNGLSDKSESRANDSLVYLTLPISSDSLTIVAEDIEGNEFIIVEDGIILEEE